MVITEEPEAPHNALYRPGITLTQFSNLAVTLVNVLLHGGENHTCPVPDITLDETIHFEVILISAPNEAVVEVEIDHFIPNQLLSIIRLVVFLVSQIVENTVHLLAEITHATLDT